MKILLIGAYGRMGKAISSLTHTYTIKKIGRRDDITTFLDKCDVVLDFSTVEAVKGHLPKILQAKKPWVIGVTGLSQDYFFTPAKKIPIFLSPNFSYGIALLKKLIQSLPEGSYEVLDTHHIHKKDAPSGTALDLSQRLPSTPKITSHREGAVIGQHKITLHLPFEKLELTHEVLDRNVFIGRPLLFETRRDTAEEVEIHFLICLHEGSIVFGREEDRDFLRDPCLHIERRQLQIGNESEVRISLLVSGAGGVW